jgi:hypothetical protein
VTEAASVVDEGDDAAAADSVAGAGAANATPAAVHIACAWLN